MSKRTKDMVGDKFRSIGSAPKRMMTQGFISESSTVQNIQYQHETELNKEYGDNFEEMALKSPPVPCRGVPGKGIGLITRQSFPNNNNDDRVHNVDDCDEEQEGEAEDEEQCRRQEDVQQSHHFMPQRGNDQDVLGQFEGQRRKENVLSEAYCELQQSLEGGPSNPELLKSFLGHIAYYIWNGQGRKVLVCHKQSQRLSKWKPERMEVNALIEGTGLGHLAHCMYEDLDEPLISAFVERWHPETNSFHLPFGEMTITLHDVAYILGIPIVGEAVYGKNKPETVKVQLGELMNLDEDGVNKAYKTGDVKLNNIQMCCSHNSVDTGSEARGYLLWLLGSTIFVDRSRNSVSAHYLPFLIDLESVKDYAWGAACLAYLYRQLGMGSRFDNAQLSGCLSLLQAWIYEYFPAFSSRKREKWNKTMPRAMKWLPGQKRNRAPDDDLRSYRRILDDMTVDEVKWTPFDVNPGLMHKITLYSGIIHCRSYTEPYMPDRVRRQFGYVQTIPGPVFQPIKCYRGPFTKKYVCNHNENLVPWKDWSNHILQNRCRAHKGVDAVEEYIDYYLSRTHPRISRVEEAKPEDVASDKLSDVARLQFLGARLLPLHPATRQTTDEETFWQCLDEVTKHMEDWMPGLEEIKKAPGHGPWMNERKKKRD